MLAVISAASSRGMPSSTTLNAPAASTALASARRRSRPPAWLPLCRPCTRWPPIRWKDCGVRPMWAITGMSTRVMASIVSAIVTPPSSLTAAAPPSFTSRTLLSIAWGTLTWYEPNGRSPTSERAGGPPAGQPGVVHHLVEGHGQRVRHALDDHAHRVADEDDVDPGLVGQRRERRVVRGDHDDLVLDRPAVRLAPGEAGDRDLLHVHRTSLLTSDDAHVTDGDAATGKDEGYSSRYDGRSGKARAASTPRTMALVTTSAVAGASPLSADGALA